MTIRILTVLAIGISVVACGENEAERNNRTALAPLVHRYFALNSEWREAALRADSETFGDAIARYDKAITDREELQSELRGVVPTERFRCSMDLAGRMIAADIAQLQTARRALQTSMRASSQVSLAQRYTNLASTSYYTRAELLKDAKDALEEATKLLESKATAQMEAARTGYEIAAMGDSLGGVVQALQLLPGPLSWRQVVMNGNLTYDSLNLGSPLNGEVCGRRVELRVPLAVPDSLLSSPSEPQESSTTSDPAV